MADGKVTLQSVDDDEDVDEFSQKHVAGARYLRNHRLVNEIFSDTVVPDVRSVVMSNRMQVLKRQVQSLTNHQQKLELELKMIDEKFEAKKRRFLEASEAFQREMKERCEAKRVDPDQKMIDKAVEEILAEKARREELLRLQKLEEQKREADISDLSSSGVPSAPVHDEATVIQTSITHIPPAAPSDAVTADPNLFLSSHETVAAESLPLSDSTSQFGYLSSNPPDIVANDSLTNDSLATTQSQDSLPPDTAATHDPAMDEDTDAEDTLDDSLDEPSDETRQDDSLSEPPILPAVEERSKPMDTSTSEVCTTAEEPDVVPAVAEAVIYDEAAAVEAEIQPALVPQLEEQSLLTAVQNVPQPDPDVPQPEPHSVCDAAAPEPNLPSSLPSASQLEVPVAEHASQVALEDIPLPPVQEPVAAVEANEPLGSQNPDPDTQPLIAQAAESMGDVEATAIVPEAAVEAVQDQELPPLPPVPCQQPDETAIPAPEPAAEAESAAEEKVAEPISEPTPSA